MRRSSSVLASLAILGAAGCLPASNPCDPAAPDEVRAQATIAGRVRLVDANNEPLVAPLGGISVTLNPLGLSGVTLDDGSFVIDDVIPPGVGEQYEMVAYPPDGFLSGRAKVPAFACGGPGEPVEVVLVAKPTAPELEIVAPTGSQKALLAFAADPLEGDSTALNAALLDVDASGLCGAKYGVVPVGHTIVDADVDALLPPSSVDYRVEVRAPFGVWRPAVIAAVPVPARDMFCETAAEEDPTIFDDPDPNGCVDVENPPDFGAMKSTMRIASTKTIDGACARTACGYFTHAYPELRINTNARCVEVIGYVDDSGVEQPLAEHGRYDFRVLTRARLDAAVADAAGLPEEIDSPTTSMPVEASLTPTVVLPVQMTGPEGGFAATEAAVSSTEVTDVVPIADGRFAVIANGGVRVLGTGQSAGSLERTDVVPVAMISDGLVAEDTAALAAEDTLEQGPEYMPSSHRARALLTAGNWIRAWTEDPESGARVDRVFVGQSGGEVASSEQADLDLAGMIIGGQLWSSFRGFRWLKPPVGKLARASYSTPGDSYLLAFDRGFVLIHGAAANNDVGSYGLPRGTALTLLQRTLGGFVISGGLLPGADPITEPLGDESFCGAFKDASGFAVDLQAQAPAASSPAALCVDMTSLPLFGNAAENLALSEVEHLRDATGRRWHLTASATRGVVYAVDIPGLLSLELPSSVNDLNGARKATLIDEATSHIKAIPVGLEPVALQSSTRLSCDADAGTVDAVPVMLVGNRGSDDVSVLAARADGFDEVAVIGLPGAPTSFVDDIDGASCRDPYAWVMTDDGKLYPIDMRTLSVVDCGGKVCSAPTRGRASAGAMSRDAFGLGRVVVGGEGLLGEVGFLRASQISDLTADGSGITKVSEGSSGGGGGGTP